MSEETNVMKVDSEKIKEAVFLPVSSRLSDVNT